MITSKKLLLERFDSYLGRLTRGFDSLQIADLIPVSRKTAERYIRDPDTIPALALELMQIKAFGLAVPVEFHGFEFRDGVLLTPDGREFAAGRILAFGWEMDRGNAVDRRNIELEKECATLQESVEFWRQKAGEIRVSNDNDYNVTG